jgi:hypothetical protein
MKKLRKKIVAAAAVTVGWWLSPLTWWNDVFVNLPIAWLVASLFANGNKLLLLVGVNVVYWATNLLGFLLMHWGGRELLGAARDDKIEELDAKKKSSFRSSMVWGVIYSAIVTALILLGIIKPLSLHF